MTTADHCCGDSSGRGCTAKVRATSTSVFIYLFLISRVFSIGYFNLAVFVCVVSVSPVCKMNVHIRCKGNVAPNCGVNSVELANKLAEMGLQAGGLSKRSSLVERLHQTEWVKQALALLKCAKLQGEWEVCESWFLFFPGQQCRPEPVTSVQREEGHWGASAAGQTAGHLQLHLPASAWQGQLRQGGHDKRTMWSDILLQSSSYGCAL